MRYEFATPEPPRLRVGLASGRVEIAAAETGETTVEVEAIRGDVENLKVEQHGRDIVIESRKRLGAFRDEEYDVRIRAPLGADADLNIASADVNTTGRLGKVEVNTASGDVELEHVERNARVRSASGDVSLGLVGGKVDVNTASGDVSVRTAAGGLSVRSASGDVIVGEPAGAITVHTASGDQRIDSVAQGALALNSMSGDVKVGIKHGSRLRVDARSLSGETTSEVELFGDETSTEGPLVELKAATMSGDIRIVRA